MKSLNHILLVFLLTTWLPVFGQSSLQGTWRLLSENGHAITSSDMIAIYDDHYFMFGHYRKDGSFIKAGGGTYEAHENQYQQTYDFYTEDSTQVKNTKIYAMQLEGNKLMLEGMQGTQKVKKTWERIEGTHTPLTGTWHFAARVDENGKAGERRKAGPRQTVKILSGNHFQWAAFNYDTREFFGTGGGTYQAVDGKYTEYIAFFSRDDNRTGQSLQFQYERQGNDWHHQGKSSMGKPLHEIWEKAQ